jgi:GNAT superfamily N-acetyltransferase
MNISISQPRKNDEVEIYQLFTFVITQNFKDYGFYEKYTDDITYEVDKQVAVLEEYFKNYGKTVSFLIAKDKDKIIGTIAYGKPSADIDKYYPEKPGTIPEIKSLYVLPEYQGKGIGTKLLDQIKKYYNITVLKNFALTAGIPKHRNFGKNDWVNRLSGFITAGVPGMIISSGIINYKKGSI